MTLEPGNEVVYQPLDARVIKLWRISQAIRSAVWLGLLLLGGLALAGAEAIGLPAAGVVWLAVFLLRLGLFFWYPTRAYRAWGYRIDGKVLEIRHGIWFRTLQLLPLSRLQHVDLHSGPIERGFGLATLLFHTAGTHQAVLHIPGLDGGEAARLRDQLVAVGGDDAV
jgi:membrane protein YdbS with pleckstrin-like domain